MIKVAHSMVKVNLQMLTYHMLNYPLKCALFKQVLTSVDISTTNDDRTMLLLIKYTARRLMNVYAVPEYIYIENNVLFQVLGD